MLSEIFIVQPKDALRAGEGHTESDSEVHNARVTDCIFVATTLVEPGEKTLLKSDPEGLLGELDQTRRIQKCKLRGLPWGPSFLGRPIVSRPPAFSGWRGVTALPFPALVSS